MAPNRKRIGITAPPAAWKRLGELLEAWRRIELRYPSRPKFAADRFPLTPQGNPNVRLVADIENAYDARINTYPAGTLREIAAGYGVTYESMTAVLEQRPGAVLAAAAAAVPAEPPGWVPPTPESRSAAVRPYADRIWKRWGDLRGGGIADPDGAALFGPGTLDAQIWDGTGARLDLPDRVWLIADLQRRDADRAGNPGPARTELSSR